MSAEHAPAAVVALGAALLWLPSKVTTLRANRRAKLANHTRECREYGAALYVSAPRIPVQRPTTRATSSSRKGGRGRA